MERLRANIRQYWNITGWVMIKARNGKEWLVQSNLVEGEVKRGASGIAEVNQNGSLMKFTPNDD